MPLLPGTDPQRKQQIALFFPALEGFGFLGQIAKLPAPLWMHQEGILAVIEIELCIDPSAFRIPQKGIIPPLAALVFCLACYLKNT